MDVPPWTRYGFGFHQGSWFRSASVGGAPLAVTLGTHFLQHEPAISLGYVISISSIKNFGIFLKSSILYLYSAKKRSFACLMSSAKKTLLPVCVNDSNSMLNNLNISASPTSRLKGTRRPVAHLKFIFNQGPAASLGFRWRRAPCRNVGHSFSPT